MSRKNLLISLLKNPELMGNLDVSGWNEILSQAHFLKLRGRLAADARTHDLWDEIPAKARQILRNAEIIAEARRRKIMWELNRVRRALRGFEGQLILLKGGAYMAQGLKCSRGRSSADLDILVAKKYLDLVEDYLLKAGYRSQILNDYDQQYYREWAHELPPLTHPDRMVEVDVHHAILQVTNRLSPNIDLMITSAVQWRENIYHLCPEDMLLHSIVHLFVDGVIKSGLRNLLEQADMMREFSGDPDFWTRLLDRAELLGLTRSCYYSLRYCAAIMETPIPDEILARADEYAPGRLILKLMDMMVHRVMNPYGQGPSKLTDYLATNGLYMRSHWLRMPPMMLLTHLMRKFFRRFGATKKS